MLRAARPLQTLRRSLHTTACRAQQATAAPLNGTATTSSPSTSTAPATQGIIPKEYDQLFASLNSAGGRGRHVGTAGKPAAAAATPEVRMPRYILHCRSFRNTIVTLTRENGEPIGSWTGGSVGFKRSGRKTYEAGYQCAVQSFKMMEDLIEKAQSQGHSGIHIELNLAGFGKGRQAVQTAFLTAEGEKIRPHIKYVIDSTPLKIGGTRGKKPRV